MFESRKAPDGTFYVVTRRGNLAHLEGEDGSQVAAVGLTEAQADAAARRLSHPPKEAS